MAFLLFPGLGCGAAGFDLLQGLATASKLFLYGFDGCSPHEGLGILIPRREKRLDGRLEVGHAKEDATADGLIIQMTEPSLHEVHPTGTGGDEMRYEAGIALQPRLYFRVLVRPVVIHDQMQGDIARKLGVESAEKFQKLLVTMSVMAFAYDLSF